MLAFKVTGVVELSLIWYSLLHFLRLNKLKEFINLVFKKAACEEIFCPLYAKLLGEVSEKYPIRRPRTCWAGFL